MRQRILDAAAVSLAENGYQATTLRGIAEAAGLKAGSIYYHFPSKEAITVSVLNEGVDYVATAVREATSALPAHHDDHNGDNGRALLKAAIDAHLSALAAHEAYTRASIRCFSMVPQEIRAQTVDIRRAFDATWLGVLKQAQKLGTLPPHTDLKALHRIILGALNWTIETRPATARETRALSDSLLSLLSGPYRNDN